MKNRKMIWAAAAAGVLLLLCIRGASGQSDVKETSRQIKTESGEESQTSWEEEKETLTESEKQQRLEEIKQEAREASVPERVISLIDQNEETVDFVRNYPQKHRKPPVKRLESEEADGKIPQLFQWDERWGYMSYGKGTIANCGCGPTCVSMVIAGLTGDLSVTPYAAAQYSEDHDFIDENDNTYWQFMIDMPQEYGLEVTQTLLSEDEMKQFLDEGALIVCSVGPGDFTDEGHFIVLTGYDEEGVILNDPFSRERSQKKWEFSKIEEQAEQMWIYEK